MTQPFKDPAQALADMMAMAQERLRQVSPPPSTGEGSGFDPLEIAKRYSALQQDLSEQVRRFWASMPSAGGNAGAAPLEQTQPASQAGQGWEGAAWGDALKRIHAAYRDVLASSVEAAPIEERAKEQVRIGLRQFVDAMNPANFLLTNPEALQLARETNGQSVVEGVRLFFQDLAKGTITTTDESAFEVGRNLATTPGAVVFENELIQLIQYAPMTAEVASRPLLIVPPCINKFYILDLQPENSFVRYALERGYPVYMVSWRSATPDIGHLTWDDYLQKGVMTAIDVTLEVSGADRVNALGFCVGGTLLACALAIMAERGLDKVASGTLLTTMLDFSDAGELGKLVSEQSVAAKEALIGDNGILPGKELAFAFSSLRANDLIWQYVNNSYLKGKAPPAFDMLYWNADSANLPGPMLCWYLRNAYLENRLRRAGETVQCGVPVDLAKVRVPAFLYASVEDHIVPWKTAYLSRQILAGDTVFVLGASGHIAGVVNHPARNKRSYWSEGAHDADPQRWFDSAQRTQGSWWPRWSAWLGQFCGPARAAPQSLGSSKFPVIEPAPGRYVMQRE